MPGVAVKDTCKYGQKAVTRYFLSGKKSPEPSQGRKPKESKIRQKTTHDTIVLSNIAFVSLKPFHLRKLLSTLLSPSPTGTSTMFSLVKPSGIHPLP